MRGLKVFAFHVAGLSLKSQDLTALFLAVRLYCSFVMEYDIHTILDSATLVATLFVIYMIRFKLRSTYMVDKDNFALYYVVRNKLLRCYFINLDQLLFLAKNSVSHTHADDIDLELFSLCKMEPHYHLNV